MFYTISEAAEIIELNPPTLRYYDKEGLLPFVKRDTNGNRMFKESDFEWLRLIECLKATGMSIKDIKQFMDWYVEGDSTLEERRKMFHERKRAVEEKIKSMQEMLEIVTYKSWFYDRAVEEGTVENIKKIKEEDIPEDIRIGKDKLSRWNCKNTSDLK